jgi:hypothetical protein
MKDFKQFIKESKIDTDEVKLVMEQELAYAYGNDSDKINLNGCIEAALTEAECTEDVIDYVKLLTTENGDLTGYLLVENPVLIGILIEVLKQIAIALGTTWAMDAIEWAGDKLFRQIIRNKEIRDMLRAWKNFRNDNEYLKKMESLISKEIGKQGHRQIRNLVKGIF